MKFSRPDSRSHGAGLLALLAALAPLGFTTAPASAQPVVQALPDPAVAELNDALRRLSRNPDGLGALVDAGRASLALNDPDAAARFFERAREQAPRDGRVLAGLGAIAVRNRDPVTAIELFNDAERNGGSVFGYESDRGLAHDLIGDNARAQGFYTQALARGESDEVTRRLALSYAIGGDRALSERVLLPLLQRQDMAAYRTRAFALAVLGQGAEAVTIIETMLPERLASRLKPYLETMPRLTRAQQAAAATQGAFPIASQIGRDDARIAAAAQRAGVTPTQIAANTAPQPVASQASEQAERSRRNRRSRNQADARLIPDGAPMGQAQAAAQQAQLDATRAAQEAEARELAERAAAEREAREIAAREAAEREARELAARETAAREARELAAREAAEREARELAAREAAEREARELAAREAAARETNAIAALEAAQSPAPGFSGELPALSSASGAAGAATILPAAAQGAEQPAVVVAALDNSASSPLSPPPASAARSDNLPSLASDPAIQAALQDQPTEPVSLNDAFADFATREFGPPASSNAGAVDIRTIEIPRERPAPPPAPEPETPPPPQHPSRQWVQVATGQDISAFRWDWRRIVRSADGLLEGRDAFHTPWGESNRLVTGPFSSAKEAQDFVSELKEKGIDSFRFTSSAGEELKAVPGT